MGEAVEALGMQQRLGALVGDGAARGDRGRRRPGERGQAGARRRRRAVGPGANSTGCPSESVSESSTRPRAMPSAIAWCMRASRCAALPVALQQVDVPERLGPVHRHCDEVRDELLQRSAVAGGRHAAAMDVQGEVEVRVVLPMRGGARGARQRRAGGSAGTARSGARAAPPAVAGQSMGSSNHSTELMTMRFVGRSMCSHAASAVDIPWCIGHDPTLRRTGRRAIR